MSRYRNLWLWPAVGIVLAALVLILSQAQPPKATSSPPPGSHQAGDVWMADLGGRTTMAMVWCPPGKFMMGSPVSEVDRRSNETQHEVTLTNGFWIGKYEVTQRQWQDVMGTNPSYYPAKEVVHWKIWKWQIPVWREDFQVNRWQLPVEQVSWNDGQEFCRKLGGGIRLPTEAEWEYACRAGSSSPFAGTGVLKEMGWFFDNNSGPNTHPVGQKKPNVWGLYDMHGNVWEWCQDWHGDYPGDAVIDPWGPASGQDRMFRGGGLSIEASDGRAAFRGARDPGDRSLDRGFRVAFGITPPPTSEAEKTQAGAAHQ
jgi:formylglycine-generating enzyme required for sulfatase activity